MKPIKAWTNEFFVFFKENLVVLFITAITIPGLSFAWINMYVNHGYDTNVPLCFADYFIITKNGIFFYVVLVFLCGVLCSLMNKNDFNINRIIRIKKSHKLWIKQSYHSILISFFISIYLLIINCVLGLLNSSVVINFNQRQSRFGLANQGVTTSQVPISAVIVITFLFGFLMFVLMNSIYQLIKWLTNKDIISCFVLIILGYCNNAGLGFSGIFSVYYTKWLPYRPASLFYLAFSCIALFIIGFKYSDYKEFLNAKSA